MINLNKESIASICQKTNIARLYAVGSSVRHDYCESSDVDLLVAFHTTEGLGQYMNAKEAFEKEFGKKVDLIEETAIKNSIVNRTLNSDKVLIYEA